jgi:hypothetical protein
LPEGTQLVFLVAAVYVLIIMTGTAIHLHCIAQWPSARGQLLHSTTRALGGCNVVQSRQDFIPEVRYEYEVNGSTYTGTRLSPWQVSASWNLRFLLALRLRRVARSSDDAVTVYYHPQRPHRSYLLRSGPMTRWITLLAGFLPLGLYWARYG